MTNASFLGQINALLQSTLLQLPVDPSDRSYAPSAPPPGLSAILTALHTHILAMQPLPALPVRAAAQRLAPVRIPFVSPSPLDGEEPKWTLGWERPKEAFVCGSWSVVGGYKRGVKRMEGGKSEVEVSRVDVAVTMPDVSRIEGARERQRRLKHGPVHPVHVHAQGPPREPLLSQARTLSRGDCRLAAASRRAGAECRQEQGQEQGRGCCRGRGRRGVEGHRAGMGDDGWGCEAASAGGDSSQGCVGASHSPSNHTR